jgi:hypothetical protein
MIYSLRYKIIKIMIETPPVAAKAHKLFCLTASEIFFRHILSKKIRVDRGLLDVQLVTVS